MKPIVFLNASLPKMFSAPIGEDGEINGDLLERLCDLATEYRFSDVDEDDRRAEVKAEYEKLKQGVKFEQRPYFVEIKLLGGELSGLPAEQPQMISCHPDTWAIAPEEMKLRYQVVEDRAPKGETITFATPVDGES